MPSFRFARSCAPLATLLTAACSLLIAAACSSHDDDRDAADFSSVGLLAGPAAAGGAGDADGVGSQARLRMPQGIAAADDGSLWITDIGNGSIRRIDAQGELRTIAQLHRALPPQREASGLFASFSLAGAIVARRGGGVDVAAQRNLSDDRGFGDASSWAVVRVDAAGRATPVFVPGAAHHPQSIVHAMAIDGRGRLFVAAGRCALWRLDAVDAHAPLVPTLVYPPPPAADESGCHDPDPQPVTRLAIDGQGRLVLTLGRGDVLRLAEDGSTSRIGATRPSTGGCGGMVIDDAGRVLLSDGGRHIDRLDDAGQPATWAGAPRDVSGWFDGSRGEARFHSVCGLARDAAGTVFAADRYGHTVRRIDAAGRVDTVVGLALQSAWRDGEGEQARFGHGFALASAGDGSLLVADTDNAVLRRVDPDGRVTTILGRPGAHAAQGGDGPADRARLDHPRHLAIAGDGSIWISNGYRLRRFDGRMLGSLQQTFDDEIVALATDLDGRVVLQLRDTRLMRLPAAADATSVPQPLAMHWSGTLQPVDVNPYAGLEATPGGLCFGREGIHFIHGHAILRRANDGRVVRLAGAIEQSGHVDGDGAAARFAEPRSLVCAPDGGVYVADAANASVRHIDAHQRVRTVLGHPQRLGEVLGRTSNDLDLPQAIANVPGGLAVATWTAIAIARH